LELGFLDGLAEFCFVLHAPQNAVPGNRGMETGAGGQAGEFRECGKPSNVRLLENIQVC
jgi:hypothetical protein